MLRSRRQFIAGTASAAALPTLAGCARSTSADYERAAAGLRAPLRATPTLADLVRYATLAANGHNTQPWRFVARAGGVSVLPDFSQRTPVVDPDDHHLWISLGCAVENLLIAAAAHGQAGAIAMRGDDSGVDVEFVAAPARDDGLLAAIPLRQSTRSVYEGKAAPTSTLTALESAVQGTDVNLRLFTTPAERERVLEFVLQGNSAQMDDPAFVAELLAWIRFDPDTALARADGLYAACSGNPTLPDWLGRRLFSFVFRKQSENDKYAEHLRSSAGVAVFTGAGETPRDWLQVGRSFQRFALRATALGLRHAHINQPIEVPAIRREFSQWLGAASARPDLVVRFGYAAALPMSLRRRVTVEPQKS
jgi:hypothetical protein